MPLDQQEEWRPVTGFPNYEISSLGNLRVCDRHVVTANGQTRFYRGGRIAPTRNQHGHLKVALVRTPGVKEWRYLHQLVAQEFIGTRPDGQEVAHRDGDEQNNDFLNLRYATPKQNNADKRAHGTHLSRSSHPGAKLSEADVGAIRRRLAAGDLQRQIADDFNVSRATISAIAVGRSWQAAA